MSKRQKRQPEPEEEIDLHETISRARTQSAERAAPVESPSRRPASPAQRAEEAHLLLHGAPTYLRNRLAERIKGILRSSHGLPGLSKETPYFNDSTAATYANAISERVESALRGKLPPAGIEETAIQATIQTINWVGIPQKEQEEIRTKIIAAIKEETSL